jgi:hypothetical protein
MKKYLLILIASSLLIACGEDPEPIEDTNIVEAIDNALTPERAKKAQQIFRTVPSPLETASIFKKAGAAYNAEFTNPVNNVNKYSTNIQKAINFGVYGADLSYANLFEQSQACMLYMNSSKKMADGLGITSAFNAETLERMEKNINNRDSLMTIINDAFWSADAYLKENGQDNLSALIIAGGWIEGLYLGTQSLNHETPNEELMQKIADQKYSINNLMELMGTYNDKEIGKMALKLAKIKATYDKIEEIEAETTVSKDAVPTIGGGSTLKYETATILEIATTVNTVRNEIIQ